MTIETLHDTIVAIATPEGASALGVVRLSGPEAVNIASEATSAPARFREYENRRAHLVQIVSGEGGLLDEAVALIWRAPGSYTGDDLVEFSCHGGRAVLRSVLGRLMELGARPADAGEFTQRAFLNGKISLDQAEAVAALIEARTGAAARTAAQMLKGRTGTAIKALQDRLLDMLARVELGLDFVEEELEIETADVTARKIEALRSDVIELRRQYRAGRMLREGARVVIAGAPNAGKSTLLNRLVGEDRAIVSETPGTTRDYLDVLLDWGGLPVRLFDTAGLRDALDDIELEGTARTRDLLQQADLVLWLVAPPGPVLPPSGDDAGLPLLLVANKCDLPQGRDLAGELGEEAIPISAVNGEGIEKVRKTAARQLLDNYDPNTLVVWEARHDALLHDTEEALGQACGTMNQNGALELVAAELRTALDSLSRITGRVHSEELLRHIFANFCIGK